MSDMPAIPFDEQLEACAIDPLTSVRAEAAPLKRTYGQILKSSAIVGGSTVLNVGIGIVRTKAMALLLGPGGFGLAGLYTSVITLTQSVAGMGVNSSGVRQIAEAAGSNDEQNIARTTAVLRRTSVLLGVLGAAALVMLSKRVAILTFGNSQRWGAVCLISLAVLFQLVSAGQGALIQGMRRIGDLAKMNVIGALSGLVISVPVVYVLREKGIALSLVLVAATTIVTSWWYSRKIRIKLPTLTAAQTWHETRGLLKLGIAFMASGLMVPGVAYFVRVFLLHQVGMAATGMYQSAWTLGGLYVGFILQAMGADFFPRLSAVAYNDAECNRLVNEQALIGLLLAGPGIIATLTFAPAVIALFYSSKFGPAVSVLRWICLGAMLQVVSWPMGFIIIAKAKQNLFVLSESLWTVAAIGLNWLCIRFYGLNGAGIAFFASYVFHSFLTYGLVFHLSGYRWSSENRRIGLVFLAAIGIVFCSSYVLTPVGGLSLGIVGVLLSTAYSLHQLLQLVDDNRVTRPIRQLVARLGLAASYGNAR
jgi:enterobacterial common antigen flippase